jgi:CheY-like chemotaxis protein
MTSRRRRRHLSVLVVDDHFNTTYALSRLLVREGYRVHAVTSAADALDVARQERFDLLVSDLDLPGRNGCDLLRKLRRLYPIPAIAITGHGAGHPLVRASAGAGFAVLLTKPLDPAALLAAVATLAGTARVAADAATA